MKLKNTGIYYDLMENNYLLITYCLREVLENDEVNEYEVYEIIFEAKKGQKEIKHIISNHMTYYECKDVNFSINQINKMKKQIREELKGVI